MKPDSVEKRLMRIGQILMIGELIKNPRSVDDLKQFFELEISYLPKDIQDDVRRVALQ